MFISVAIYSGYGYENHLSIYTFCRIVVHEINNQAVIFPGSSN